MGPIDQQFLASPAATLQPAGPAGRRQPLVDGLGRDRPTLPPQSLCHRPGHGAVGALPLARQTKGLIATQRFHPTQLRASGLGLPGQHRCHLRLLRATDRQRPGLKHPRLFGGDRREAGAQVFAVVEADAGDAEHLPIRVGAGGIKAPPQAHLQHRQLDGGVSAMGKSGTGEQLKGGELVPFPQLPPAAHGPTQLRASDPLAIELEPLAPTHQVGGPVNGVAHTRRLENRPQKGADRTLAIAAGHLHGGELAFGMTRLRQGRLQPPQGQVDAPLAEGFEQVGELDRIRKSQ